MPFDPDVGSKVAGLLVGYGSGIRLIRWPRGVPLKHGPWTGPWTNTVRLKHGPLEWTMDHHGPPKTQTRSRTSHFLQLLVSVVYLLILPLKSSCLDGHSGKSLGGGGGGEVLSMQQTCQPSCIFRIILPYSALSCEFSLYPAFSGILKEI